MADPRLEYVLRLGDSPLILSQQLGAWCGHAPVLEEDIAIANTALDLIGQTTLWLDLAGKIEGEGRSADDLAYLRDASDFKNVLLVEQPNGDFGHTLMRQFLFDAWHLPLLKALVRSSDDQISAVAQKGVKEVAYHLERSKDLVERLADGTEESHERMQSALDRLWPFTGELVEADDVDLSAEDAGYGAPFDEVASEAMQNWRSAISAGGLLVDEEAHSRRGGKSGLHSEHLGYILAEMQILHRSHPGAKW